MSAAIEADQELLPALLTVKEVATALRLSTRKIWEMTASGELPTVRAGRAVRIDRRDVEDWIVANKNL